MVAIKDEIHRLINVNEIERRVIDTNEFQRLRRIKQLGMTYLVYPNAMHTRFEHGIGTMHITSLMCERLEIDKELSQKIRLYALLHDVGHAPFSHESEKVLERYFGDHEKVGLEKIQKGEIAEIINENYLVKDIISISKQIYGKIVSSAIGSDRMDYLLRDSHNTGVAYGVIDSDRILDTLFMDSKRGVLGIDEGGIEAVEYLLIGRFMMFSTVYLHQTVRTASAMLVEMINSAIEEKVMKPEELLSASDEEVFIKCLNGKKSKEFANRLINRRLFKVAYSCPYSTKMDEKIGKLEKEISEKIESQIIIDKPIPFSKSFEEIVVKFDNGELKKLKSISKLVKSLSESEDKRRKLLFLVDASKRDKVRDIAKNLELDG